MVAEFRFEDRTQHLAGFAFNDFASGEVAVLLGLDQGVFVDRFAKVFAVIGGDFLIVSSGVFGFVQLARRGGEANVDGVDLRPTDQV